MKRDIKVLLELLSNLIHDEKNNIKCYDGFCLLLFRLKDLNIINLEELTILRKCLDSCIKSDFSRKYPVTYRRIPFLGTFSYYFEPYDWNVRKAWLAEVIQNLKEEETNENT